jgi:hypothetical protein
MVSLDDDNQRMRTYKCKDEQFVRQRHAAKGGFGPVQHVAVSQLTHFVLGGIINSPGSSDAESLQGLLMDMDDQAQVWGDTNHHGAKFWVDGGYHIPSIVAIFEKARCNVYGTQQRQKTKKLFPYTFDHEDVPHKTYQSLVHQYPCTPVKSKRLLWAPDAGKERWYCYALPRQCGLYLLLLLLLHGWYPAPLSRNPQKPVRLQSLNLQARTITTTWNRLYQWIHGYRLCVLLVVPILVPATLTKTK